MTYADLLSRVEKGKLYSKSLEALGINGAPKDWRERMIESSLYGYIYWEPTEYADAVRYADMILTEILDAGGRMEAFAVSLHDTAKLVKAEGGDMQDATNALALLGATALQFDPLIYSNGGGVNSVTRLA
ncbi:hypothetical protein [Defluviimonas sp. SAOS-178_SWC]|uniref:hypothetical protein n=1 Tax=Defluviimonas sp. SAOS-178_SWC TaxID=3121287 RepID=UPI0032218C8F